MGMGVKLGDLGSLCERLKQMKKGGKSPGKEEKKQINGV